MITSLQIKGVYFFSKLFLKDKYYNYDRDLFKYL